jgi:hypothetical protein
MYILEMMKKDVNSVVGLTVTLNFNVVPVVSHTGVVKFAERRDYSWTVDDVKTDIPRYLVSFDGTHYFTVDRFVTGYEL